MPSKSFSVDLVIVTPDGLRKIDFRLLKASKNEVETEWTMEFELSERKSRSDSFIQIIKLNVKVEPADNSKAEATATKGLDDDQIKAALLAADSAKALNAGEISRAKAEAAARQVITVRKF